MVKLAFLGLGVMGYPMAGHLQAAAHDVCVYNRSPAKAADWVAQHGGNHAPTPREAATDAEFVFVCVGNDDDVRSVVLGNDGALAGMAAGSVLVDHTTASATLAQELYDICNQHGIGFMDAPVSGGQAGAENGALAIMCGGDQAVFDKATPVMDSYAKIMRLIGGAGHGQTAKMVNQICIAGVVQGLSEGLALAMDSGLDTDTLLEVISGGAAGSWQMENRGKTMVEGSFDFGFAVDWMRKDLAIAMQHAKETGTPLPLTELVDQFYAEVQDMNGNRQDTSSLIRRLRA